MLAQALAILDIVAGVAIAGQTYIGWNPLTWIGIIILGKAIYSIISSAASKFYFDWIGWLDLFIGIVILVNWHIPLFFLVPIIKGIYSLAMIRM